MDTALTFDLDEHGRIRAIYVVRNPDKLMALAVARRGGESAKIGLEEFFE